MKNQYFVYLCLSCICFRWVLSYGMISRLRKSQVQDIFHLISLIFFWIYRLFLFNTKLHCTGRFKFHDWLLISSWGGLVIVLKSQYIMQGSSLLLHAEAWLLPHQHNRVSIVLIWSRSERHEFFEENFAYCSLRSVLALWKIVRL